MIINEYVYIYIYIYIYVYICIYIYIYIYNTWKIFCDLRFHEVYKGF